MVFIYGPYTWNSLGSSDEDNWIFVSPLGTGVNSTNNRYWRWNNTDTPSFNLGPTSGQGGAIDGYLYTEASFPTNYDDEFTMELDHDLNGSNGITIQLYTNQRGNSNNTTCKVQTNEGGVGWVTRETYGGPDDPNKVSTSGSQIWAERNLNLTGVVSHEQTRIRLLLKMPSDGTIWHNDYGIDNITVTVTDNSIFQTHQMML
jgi:hypothetical protein